MKILFAVQIFLGAVGVGAFIRYMRIPIETRDYIVSKRYPGAWGNAYSRDFWRNVADTWEITRDAHLLTVVHQQRRALKVLFALMALSFLLQIARSIL